MLKCGNCRYRKNTDPSGTWGQCTNERIKDFMVGLDKLFIRESFVGCPYWEPPNCETCEYRKAAIDKTTIPNCS